ncbi:hypothetical protein AMTRI_Chr12g274170 [Amborella trichopoda]
MDDHHHPRAPSSSAEPPWFLQETKNLLSILSLQFDEAEQGPMGHGIRSDERERGHNRAHHQCKSRWEGLLSLYKGKKKRESEREVEWLRKLAAAEAQWRSEVEKREREGVLVSLDKSVRNGKSLYKVAT